MIPDPKGNDAIGENGAVSGTEDKKRKKKKKRKKNRDDINDETSAIRSRPSMGSAASDEEEAKVSPALPPAPPLKGMFIKERSNLPVFQHRADICNLVSSNEVVLVVAETVSHNMMRYSFVCIKHYIVLFPCGIAFNIFLA